MFSKILIANRGEIACRVAATAARMGVKTVAVYADIDRDARHVRACDEAVAVGGNAPRDSYLHAPRILQAARSTGAQAIHPGYGFLSENADFARACAAAGLVFIGPPPQAIAAMGSKSAAKALMEQASVPLVPGYHGECNEADFLADEARRIGYPVLIKATAGGGGRGMRRVDRPDDFAAALASCQREAEAAFGDSRVLVERCVTRPRHIEIQVFADTHGNCIHLHERDCSVQRRHQKVLEESPAPGLSAERRAEMGAAAVAAARAVGYVGAGTVEFIAEPDPERDGDIRFYFMEMNTRLQVEHPVTEAVTGLDLVAWQLCVASGEPLPLAQHQVPLAGHAIEARLCAENPEAGFLPATGTLSVLRWPEHVAFARHERLPRVDSGVREGDAISPHHDSMIAKLIVWGDDRHQALARLSAALAQTHLVGPASNLAFLQRLLASRAFATADLDTALIEREREALFEGPSLPLPWAAAAVCARRLADAQAQQDDDPWSRRDAWRVFGSARQRLALRLGEQAFTAELERHHDGRASLLLQGQRLDFRALPLMPLPAAAGAPASQGFDITLGTERARLWAYGLGERVAVFAPSLPGGSAIVVEHDPLLHAADAAETGGGLCAPMPGKVLALRVRVGERVRRGQPLAVLEAMKMEHQVTAPHDGVVQALLCAEGEQVAEGAELLRLQPPA